MLCSECRGSGAENPDDVKKCTSCGGKGVKIVKKQLGPGFVQQMQTTCDVCGGKGTIATSKCPHCGGTKVEIGEDTLIISIERGMPDGYPIVFSQAGDVQPDTTPGDLRFQIVTRPDPEFSREGNDLHYTMRISLLEALVGYERQIEHLDGRIIPITRSKITVPGLLLLPSLCTTNKEQVMYLSSEMKECRSMNSHHNLALYSFIMRLCFLLI